MNKRDAVRKPLIIILGLFFGVLVLEGSLRMTSLVRTSIQQYHNARRIGRGDALRIVCLGDSMTEIGYPAYLERALNKKSRTAKFAVINKGMSLTGTAYVASILDDCIREYSPWMVIVMSGIQDGDDLAVGGDDDARDPAFYEKLKVYRLCVLLRREVEYKLKEMKSLKSLPPPAGPGEPDYERCLFLGTEAVNRKEFAGAEAMYKKAIALSPERPHAYWKLKELYAERMQDPAKAERWLQGLIRAHPRDDALYHLLADVCMRAKNTDKAKEYFLKTIALNPDNAGAWFSLMQLSRQDGSNSELARFKKMLVTNGDRLYGAAAVQYMGEKNYALADAYFTKAEAIRSRLGSRTVRDNLRVIVEKAQAKNVRVALMQYPMRSIEPLKAMMRQQKGIIFIDNERLFKDALRRGKFDDYFVDQFAGDFGHYSARGMELLGDHMADVILAETGVRRN